MGILSKLIGTMSGSNSLKVSDQLLFDKVIGFRGIVPGCGVSTIVQNVAIALSERTKFNICVLDTNFLYPMQYPLLVSAGEDKEKREDILDFASDISKITVATQYHNVYLADISNRTVVDMLSGKDSQVLINKVMGSLKSFFDIILVDLSYEPTHISIGASIKCNKIYQVADTSLKCLYNVKKSINTMSTLATPLAKANTVIVNKQLPNILLGLNGAMAEAELRVLGEIPLSLEIAGLCASGKKIYGTISRNAEVTAFNAVIDKIVEDIAIKTPKIMPYINIQQLLAEKAKMREAENSTELVDTASEIEEIGGFVDMPSVEDTEDMEGVDND